MKKILSVLTITTLILNLSVIYTYAQVEKPRVVSVSKDPISGYYAVYEYKGQSYRSDEMGSAFNRNMWKLMDDTDRQKVVSALSYKSSRIAQFGQDGNEIIMNWYKETNEWSKAKKQWEERVSKKNFPGLSEFYGSNLETLFESYNANPYYIPGRNKTLHDDYYMAKAEMLEIWKTGYAAYSILGHLKGRQITVAVNFGSKEIIKMLSDTYFMPALTRGAKPTSDALAQVLGFAADQGMGAVSATPSAGEQIAQIESIITQCEAIAYGVMQNQLPAKSDELSDIIKRIEEDNEKVAQEYNERMEQAEQERMDKDNQTNMTFSSSQSEGISLIDQNISLSDLLGMQTPTSGVSEATLDDYLEYCALLESKIASKMAEIRSQLIEVQDEFDILAEQYAQLEQDVLTTALLEEFPSDAKYLSLNTYLDVNPFVHNWNYFKCLDINTVEAIEYFNWQYEGNPYYKVIMNEFFDDDLDSYDTLIDRYTALKEKVGILNDYEGEFFAAMGGIYGKCVALENKINELESQYYSKVIDSAAYGWDMVNVNKSVSAFFTPLYPVEESISSTKLNHEKSAYKDKFHYISEAFVSISDEIEQYEQEKEELSLVRQSYGTFVSELESTIIGIANKYFAAKANYENAITQAVGAVEGLEALYQNSEYFSKSGFSSYTYDGKGVSFLVGNGSVMMWKIQNDITSSLNQNSTRLNIISSLKSLKSQEEHYLKLFEKAKIHAEFYESELIQLSTALGFYNYERRLNLEPLVNGSLESAYEIRQRLLTYDRQDKLLIPELYGSNISHAIEMLEGRTDSYFKVDQYRNRLDYAISENSQSVQLFSTSSNYENTLRAVYTASLNVFQNECSSTISYAQNEIQAQHSDILNVLGSTGSDYFSEQPAPAIDVSYRIISDDTVTTVVTNDSGGKLTAKIIAANYTPDGQLLEMKSVTILNLENMFSECRDITFSSSIINLKVFLWEDLNNIKPLV